MIIKNKINKYLSKSKEINNKVRDILLLNYDIKGSTITRDRTRPFTIESFSEDIVIFPDDTIKIIPRFKIPDGVYNTFEIKNNKIVGFSNQDYLIDKDIPYIDDDDRYNQYLYENEFYNRINTFFDFFRLFFLRIPFFRSFNLTRNLIKKFDDFRVKTIPFFFKIPYWLRTRIVNKLSRFIFYEIIESRIFPYLSEKTSNGIIDILNIKDQSFKLGYEAFKSWAQNALQEIFLGKETTAYNQLVLNKIDPKADLIRETGKTMLNVPNAAVNTFGIIGNAATGASKAGKKVEKEVSVFAKIVGEAFNALTSIINPARAPHSLQDNNEIDRFKKDLQVFSNK